MSKANVRATQVLRTAMQRQFTTVWQRIKPWLQAFSFLAVGVGVISSFMNLYSAKQPPQIDVTSFNNATLQILSYLAISSQGAQHNCSLCAIMDQVRSMQLTAPTVPPPSIKQVAARSLRVASGN